MSRLDNVYRYQLYREGVIAEIMKLSMEEPEPELKTTPSEEPTMTSLEDRAADTSNRIEGHDSADEEDEGGRGRSRRR